MTGLAQISNAHDSGARISCVRARVLVDTASTESYIRRAVADDLQLEGPQRERTLHGIAGQTSVVSSTRVKFLLRNTSGQTKPIEISCFTMDKICDPLSGCDIDPRRFFPSIDPCMFAENFPADCFEIDVLLGIEYLHLIDFHCKVSANNCNSHNGKGLMAFSSPIGFLIGGPLKTDKRDEHSSSYLTIENFWNLESLGLVDSPTHDNEDDRYVRDHFSRNITFCPEENRYVVRFCFRKTKDMLKSNYDIALRRLQSTERRLAKDAERAAVFGEQVRELLRRDWVEEVDVQSSNVLPEKATGTFYLPTSIVERPDAESTKNRLVFDGSCRTVDGMRVNDVLFPGPKTQSDILNILLGLRMHRVVLKADISKMFHQVVLHPADRDFVRFLWRDLDPQKPVRVMRWKRLPFGLNQSPFLAIATVQWHVKYHEMEFHNAAAALQKCLYVDDYIGGVDSVEEAKELRQEISVLMNVGGFHFAKWISNSKEVLASIPPADRAAASAFAFREHDTEMTEELINKTLGISWNPESDRFCYYGYSLISFEPGRETKRSLISKMSRIFDPTGFLSPFVVRAKMLMQETWLAGIGWDDLLPIEIDVAWQDWLDELPDLAKFSPPRCLKPANDVLFVELHMFSDASEKAYATVAYLRFVESSSVASEGPVSCGLLVAKSRVAPLKKITLPRLELLGCLLSCRMANRIVEELGFDRSSVHFWTDNTTVVQWLRKPPNVWPTFVANRVSEIQSSYSPEQFHHIAGKLNISADIASRGCSASDLTSRREWIYGPEFLYDPPELWPANRSIGDADLETAYSSLVVVSPDDSWVHIEENVVSPSLSADRPYGYYQRIAMWVLRFIRECRLRRSDRVSWKTGDPYPLLLPTLVEVREADLFWCRLVQHSALLSELSSVKGGGDTPAKLMRLSPYWDEKSNLLKVGGRIQFSDLPERSIHQVILPAKHPISEKLIKHAHVALHHAGLHHTHFFLRSRFWILNGKSEIRRVLHQCRPCRRQKAKPYEQKMAPLPPERLKPNLAFTIVGVDTAGPLKVKELNGDRTDAHIIVWTCFSTRAVHLGVLRSLHTDSIIASLKEFCYRRGIPKSIYSDNHKSFRKCDRELARLWKNVDKDRIRRESLSLPEPIEWHFIVERAPWMGGIWERMVRSVKTALRSCLGQALVTRDELQLTIAGIEAQLNSRPLTHISSDPDDFMPITPAHLLYGRGLNQLPDFITRDDAKDKVAVRWRLRSTLLDHFWRRWRKEYLTELQASQKWHTPQKGPRLGEIVLVGEDNVPRSQWVLGRIIECKEGRDGLIRSCILRTPRGIIRRPLLRLYRMEDDVEEQ
jgi:hypothetical protein